MKNPPLSTAVVTLLLLAFPISGFAYQRGVRVRVSPSSATVQVGASQQFNASVWFSRNAGVYWLVNGVRGGNSTVGTISSAGLYTAPANVPSTGVRVTAQSVVQLSATASATVYVTGATSTPSPTVSVTITPTSATLQTGQSAQFTASVSGSSNTAVNWLVNGIAGGNSAVGSINTGGFYTAPATAPSGGVTVTAQSVAQTSVSASATVSVMPATVTVAISPTNTSLQVGQSLQFSASVSGTSNTGVNWLVSGITGGNSTVGTITSTGLYTAPLNAPATSVSVTAVSSASSSSSASCTVTITQPVQHSVTLSWNPSTSTVVGYNIYRGTLPNSLLRINSSLSSGTIFTDKTVTSGQTYYYATTAVDSKGTESAYSNQVQANIP